MVQLIAIASSTEILFLVLILLACIGLILIFIRSILRERRRIAEQKEKEGTLTTDEFFDLLGKILDASKKSTLVLLRIDIFDSMALFKSVGEMQYNTAFEQLISRIYQVMGLNIKVARQDDDLVYVYMRTNKIGNANLDNLCRTLITEINKSIIIAGMLKVDFDINVGVVTYPGGGKTVDAIQQNLQLAVVAAKRKGINQYAFYDISLTNQESDEYKSFLEIKSAIDNKDFTLYYQPIVNLSTLEVASAESLLRWKHKERGILPPSSFLSVMEHTGDINWVGFWALENLFKQHASWITQYPDITFFLSTNLSDKQLMNPQLAEEVRRLAKKFKISPINFCFEILQSCFETASADSMIINNVKALKNMGFLITIDNFGASDTSLNSIISIVNVDMIKLSRGYINQSVNSEFTYDMIKMLVGYANKNDIKMVAEGVETAENLEYIKKLGIQYGQGFYFAKPGAPADLMNAVVMTPWTANVVAPTKPQTIVVEPDDMPENEPLETADTAPVETVTEDILPTSDEITN
ncbi:MAG: GGDEF domain-containing phosphodiesterase [Christensenellaceae bacterium]|jgi:EAL domain-containing protein (putative c-di-GMP-specific phosphodiesterase class I)/GGDEF domain-containing protein|nr:GGDEF domain-containing phosphodiesterase [Christensenellaceae bacterium]